MPQARGRGCGGLGICAGSSLLNYSRSVGISRGMIRVFILFLAMAAAAFAQHALPFDTVFKGEARFTSLVAKVRPHAARLREISVGERTAWFGQILVGTKYQGFTLEIDDHVEAPSVNFHGLDCWTMFETALALARMVELPEAKWTPESLLYFIEQDRYWGGKCDGSYCSRLHYLEDWAKDNDRRGYVKDLTRSLGGVGVPNQATEMTTNWRGYRYMRNSEKNRSEIAKLEEGLRRRPLYMIPKSRVPEIEGQLQNGDIIGIISHDGVAYGTSHVGIALRKDGVLRFLHASAPSNHGRVVVDSRLSDYLGKFKKHAGILVARPIK